ncbi:MAG: antibiotic biosynthesis monooxygenase [Rhodospirillales bacterium CG15_BIG_FIL_POST_REV_8_21_14_020_66_15]|nr:MAG: antibiotic biosynthesis monooxygenase [Rhodospirillales bacterium CG15_BIG_FIL_POST_REV_8_21_14_020_66_15]
MFVVTVTFVIKPQHIAEFQAAMIENARTSVEIEPSCRRFDVCRDPKNPSVTFLYEIYDDAEAFEAHKATSHFKSFDALGASWIASKEVKTWILSG